jgi:acyl-CoA reductase-like NAD-dependent aldehyde dehydrogenase
MMGGRTSSAGELDAAVDVLRSRKDDWAALPIDRRIALLQRCLEGALRTAPAVVRAGCEAKGIDPRSAASGEEWMSGPIGVIRQVRLFIETLADIRRTGHPSVSDRSVHRLPTGELAVTVFPRTRFERVMYPGTRIDVWMQPGVEERTLRDTMATAYRPDARSGRVAVVLGAGNVASIGPADVLYKLIVENQVAVLKMHPVNEYLGRLVDLAFQSLVDAGYMRVVYGGASEGQHLIHHPGVDEVHMTGSTAVHDRIVWGDTPEEQARRRTAGTPRVSKRVTSELGCVTPVIVVPGRWTDAELQYQAEHVATMVVHSASCTCTSTRLLVTSRAWAQRQAFLDCVAGALARQVPRLAYYPGSADKYRRFTEPYPQARRLGEAGGNALAPVVVYDVDPAPPDDVLLNEEAWSPVLAETALAGADDAEFLDAAVRFCNERVFGTLSMVLLVTPESRSRLGAEMDRAVASLRYGTVSVNHWSAVSFIVGVAPWGAYPGHTLDDIGSGIGVVHNTLMFERPLKSVVWGPFIARPKPPWFTTHRRAHVVGRRMAPFEAAPAAWRLLGIALAALRPGG